MATSTEISSRFWNLPQKAGEEVLRESNFMDDIIQKAHIEKEILAQLGGIRTAFDGGAGCGRFSLLLAERGVKVTHFDISLPMIEKAKDLAGKRGVLDNMTFVHGSLEDLSSYQDKQFDMVLSFDAPISYTYPDHEQVIGELVRICAKRIIISVYSRPAYVSYTFSPMQKKQYIMDPESNDPLVRWYMENEQKAAAGFVPDVSFAKKVSSSGLFETPEEVAETFEKGGTPWPVSYAFMPDELQGMLERFGARDVKLAGPGALSRSIPAQVLRNIMGDEKLKRDFLDFCYLYDSNPYVCAMGKDNIVASANI